jgi:hypothetical protein
MAESGPPLCILGVLLKVSLFWQYHDSWAYLSRNTRTVLVATNQDAVYTVSIATKRAPAACA